MKDRTRIKTRLVQYHSSKHATLTQQDYVYLVRSITYLSLHDRQTAPQECITDLTFSICILSVPDPVHKLLLVPKAFIRQLHLLNPLPILYFILKVVFINTISFVIFEFRFGLNQKTYHLQC